MTTVIKEYYLQKIHCEKHTLNIQKLSHIKLKIFIENFVEMIY